MQLNDGTHRRGGLLLFFLLLPTAINTLLNYLLLLHVRVGQVHHHRARGIDFAWVFFLLCIGWEGRGRARANHGEKSFQVLLTDVVAAAAAACQLHLKEMPHDLHLASYEPQVKRVLTCLKRGLMKGCIGIKIRVFLLRVSNSCLLFGLPDGGV